jgi:alkyl hydroperoxide reductase subunit AhpF
MIGEAERQYIRAELDRQLQGEVELVLLVRPEVARLYVPGRVPNSSRETQQLLEELVGLSDRLRLTVYDVAAEPERAAEHGVDPEVTPALLLKGAAQGRLRMFGLPAGYEFRTLLDSIIAVSQGSGRLSEAGRAEVAALSDPVHIQVFVTPT